MHSQSGLITFVLALIQTTCAAGPFFTPSGSSYIIGNDLWNITIGTTYGKQLYYKNKDIVGSASGHYAGYSGSSLAWTSAKIASQNSEYLDIVFTANEGDFHWVIYPELAGAYQYFVNKALPVLGEFRSLVRLDNDTFPNGKTASKDGPLPTLAELATGTNVQDETWQLPNGTYITKYDWADFIRSQHYYGVYGTGLGSWYIYPGKDEYNGNHLKQELLVHRETKTGDAVQLNMIHGTHFQASSSDTFAVGKTWGPWLWYLNDGTSADASNQADIEEAAWPYTWFTAGTYQSRGTVSGILALSDGRVAAGAAVFLGDNNSAITSLDMGANNYYTTYADADGAFRFTNVRSGAYGLQAWSNGAPIGDVSTTYVKNNVEVTKDVETALGSLIWATTGRTQIFKLGELDRKATGFTYSNNMAREHGLSSKCPTDLKLVMGTSKTIDWCYAQSSLGTWTISFSLATAQIPANSTAVLIVSLAGYSSGVSSNVFVNSVQVGSMSTGSIPSDPSLYRSGNTAGEHHLLEFSVAAGVLKAGANEVAFTVTRESKWHGFMWDAVVLEWAN